MFYFVLGLVGFIFGWFVSGVLVSRKWFPFAFAVLLFGRGASADITYTIHEQAMTGTLSAYGTLGTTGYIYTAASMSGWFTAVNGGFLGEGVVYDRTTMQPARLYALLTLDQDGERCVYLYGAFNVGPLYRALEQLGEDGYYSRTQPFASGTSHVSSVFPGAGTSNYGFFVSVANESLMFTGLPRPTSFPSGVGTSTEENPTTAPTEFSDAEDSIHEAIADLIPTGSQLTNIGTTSRDAFDDVIPVNTLLNVLGAGTLSPTTQQAHDAFATLVNHFAPSMAPGPGVLTEGMGTFATPAATIVSAAFVSNYSGAFPTPSWSSIIDRWMVAIGALQGQVPVAFSFVRFIGGFIVTWGFVWAMWRMLCWAVGEKMPSMMTVVGWLPGWWKWDDEELPPPSHYGLGDGEDWKDADVHDAIAGSSHYAHAMDEAFDEIDSDDPGRQ